MDHQFEAAVGDNSSAKGQIEAVIVDAPRVPRLPSTVLLFELVLACAYSPDLIERITIHDQWAAVVRGERPLDPDTFDISTCYRKGGRRLITGL
jgi:hypothetical protein